MHKKVQISSCFMKLWVTMEFFAFLLFRTQHKQKPFKDSVFLLSFRWLSFYLSRLLL